MYNDSGGGPSGLDSIARRRSLEVVGSMSSPTLGLWPWNLRFLVANLPSSNLQDPQDPQNEPEPPICLTRSARAVGPAICSSGTSGRRVLSISGRT